MTQALTPLPVRSHLLASDSTDALAGTAGATPGAAAADVQRFEEAMQRGIDPASRVDAADPSGVAPADRSVMGSESLGDAILGTLSRLSTIHQETQHRVGQVLAAPDSEFTARRMLEVQAALGEHSIVTQFVAGVSTQLTRLVDQTVKMQ